MTLNMPNKLTILTDGGWLLMSRLFAFEKDFATDNSAAQKRAAAGAFKESLSQSMSRILNQFQDADNIILMSEGGSWRKNLPIPKQLEDTTYKGHREKKPLDWTAIYKAYNEFSKICEAAGITISCHSAIEGDDWAWYWSRRLNAEGTNVLIWTSDCDLKQLVQVHNNCFTAWYNDKAGLVLPNCMEWKDDPIECMMNPPYQNEISSKIVHRIKKVEYINPDLIVINKVLCGDAGDNIKACVRFKKNNRTYRFADSDYKKFMAGAEIESVQDLIDQADNVANNIATTPKFANQGATADAVREMIDYNLRLVWLNEAVIPETVTTAMVQFEYKIFNVADLKHNHKLLMGQNTEIEDIFNGINI